MFEYKELKKRMFYEGVELASFLAEYPFFKEIGFVSVFYEDIVGRCFNWFCEKYYPVLLEQYIGDTNPRKRFEVLVHRYEIKFKVGHFDGDLLSLRCEVGLYKGRKEVLSRYCDAQNFDLSQKSLISPSTILKKLSAHLSKKEVSFLREKPIYVDAQSKPFYFDGAEWKEILQEKSKADL